MRRSRLGIHAQLSPTEIVRRCEGRVGELVRQGHDEGSITSVRHVSSWEPARPNPSIMPWPTPPPISSTQPLTRLAPKKTFPAPTSCARSRVSSPRPPNAASGIKARTWAQSTRIHKRRIPSDDGWPENCRVDNQNACIRPHASTRTWGTEEGPSISLPYDLSPRRPRPFLDIGPCPDQDRLERGDAFGEVGVSPSPVMNNAGATVTLTGRLP
jgi:hypothetical protein